MRQSGSLSILVNTAEDEGHVRMTCAEPIYAIAQEAKRVAREYPGWTSMVIVITNSSGRQMDKQREEHGK